MVLAVGNDGQFAKFCAVAGRPEWAQDPDFATNAARVGARDRLVPLVAAALATRPRDHWLAKLEDAGVPCGPINDIGQALAHPQVAARGMLVESELANGERLRMVGNPLKFSETPLDLNTPPPLLGR